MGADLRAQLAVLRVLLDRPVRSAALWGLAFGLVVYSSSATYVHAYPSVAQRLVLAHSLGTNIGLQSLFGPTRALDTVGGFAAWRSLGLLTIVGSVWGVLTGARLLRGEEEAGRWETLLSGRVTRRRAAALGVLAATVLVGELFALTALGAQLGASAGHLSVRSCLFLALVLVTPAATFLSVGLLAGQVTATRSAATRVAGALFGAAFLIRVISVAGGIGWLRWTTPLGWVEATHPMTGSSAVPLLAVAALLIVLYGSVAVVSGRRDLGAGLLPQRPPRESSEALLTGPTSLAVRLTGGAALGWLTAVVVICSVLGLVSKSVGQSAAHSQMVDGLLDRLGATHAGSVAFLGLAMLTVTAMVALAAAGAISAVRETEADGLADAVLVTPVTRARWLGGRVLVNALVLIGLGMVIAVVLAVVTAGQHLGVSTASMLGAGINAVPVAIVVLGAGVLVFAVAPRATAAAAYGLVAWSFLDELVGGAINAPNWMLDLSLFHHVALAPAADPRWGTNLVLVTFGVACAGVGVLAFRRRDLLPA